MATLNLSAPERETVIVWTDADEKMMVSSSQRKVITQLLRNPGFEETERVTEDKRVVLLSGFLPLGGITIRKAAKGTIKRSDAGKRKGLPANAARCGEPKADGNPCQALASKDTGKCARHS